MAEISEDVLDAAIAAYGVNKSVRVDRNRLRRAIEAATLIAFREGYKQGFEAAQYNDTGKPQ